MCFFLLFNGIISYLCRKMMQDEEDNWYRQCIGGCTGTDEG